MKELIIVVLAILIGWAARGLIFQANKKTHGFLFVENTNDHPGIYLQLLLDDVEELKKLKTVNFSVKIITPKIRDKNSFLNGK